MAGFCEHSVVVSLTCIRKVRGSNISPEVKRRDQGFRDYTQGKPHDKILQPPPFAGFSICYPPSFVFRIHVVWVTQDFFRSTYRVKVLVGKPEDKRIFGKSRRRRELSSPSPSPPPHSLSYHRSTVSCKASSQESVIQWFFFQFILPSLFHKAL